MDTPRHDDIDNPPDYCTLRNNYWELWDRLRDIEVLGLFTQDHKTKAFRKELRGADVRFDGESGLTQCYVHRDDIELCGDKQGEKMTEREQLAISEEFTDTDRLDYLLQFIRIDDVGDDECCKGIVVDSESMEEKIGLGPDGSARIMRGTIHDWNDDLRDVIDRAMVAHSFLTKAQDDSQSPAKNL